MELGELIALRPVPAAGLLLTLTRRCPLSCAHCSTSSTAAGEQTAADLLRGFVASFTAANAPRVVLLTGGEPLLRPDLAAGIAELARAVGTRTALLSGMFFARGGGRVPARIMRAITAADHFSASLDVHHEREVARADVFAAVHRVLDAGVPASFHLTGTGPDDPYLVDVVAAVRAEFADRVPMLVNDVRPVGRAASWTGAAVRRDGTDGGAAVPCPMAAWPTVAFDGTVVACCGQRTVDARPVPAHLLLGHLAEDDWETVRARSLGSPVLRMLRVVGPGHLSARYAPGAPDLGRCGTCRALADRPDALAGAARDGSGPVGELLDRHSAHAQLASGPVEFVRRHGTRAYAGLVSPAPEGGRP
ncbi:radical SAM protein [Streptomyces sp. NBC_00247]|uniref:radical SAM protein n=1 Tax=Streptomyces sp. NBC_00247 TaxID=2975689 RepID=UPI002E280DE5|nr:radical SAM protein [Streptomyces sp. NBC_00247]